MRAQAGKSKIGKEPVYVDPNKVIDEVKKIAIAKIQDRIDFLQSLKKT